MNKDISALQITKKIEILYKIEILDKNILYFKILKNQGWSKIVSKIRIIPEGERLLSQLHIRLV
jgi:hypothetical protein